MSIQSKLEELIKRFTKSCEDEGVIVSIATIYNEGELTTALILETEESRGNHNFRPEA